MPPSITRQTTGVLEWVTEMGYKQIIIIIMVVVVVVLGYQRVVG